MQRDRDHPPRRDSFDDEALGEELSQRLGEAAPSLVLETMHRVLDRPFVGDRGAEPGKRPQPCAASARPSRRWQLHATPAAQRLLEATDLRAAALAQPRADSEAPAAARRQKEVEQGHETSVWTRSTRS